MLMYRTLRLKRFTFDSQQSYAISSKKKTGIKVLKRSN